MAEALLGGLGIGSFFQSVGNGIYDFFKLVVKYGLKFLHMVAHYIRVAIHYFYQLGRHLFAVASRFYNNFQLFPFETMQLLGTLYIMVS